KMHQPNTEFVGLLRGAGSRLRLANPDQVAQSSRAKRRRQGDRQLEPGDESLSAHVPVRIQLATYLFLAPGTDLHQLAKSRSKGFARGPSFQSGRGPSSLRTTVFRRGIKYDSALNRIKHVKRI